ncbi:MAG: hypothetical protein ACK40X_04100 [Armatimonadota bacterium]
MVWVLMATLMALSELPTLKPNEPIVGKVGAGENLRFRLTIPAGRRAIVTLIPLDGDADLFVSLPRETPTSKTPFKSVNPALQIERIMLPRQTKQTEATVLVSGVTETQFVLALKLTERRVILEPTRTILTEVQWQEIAFSENDFLGALTVVNKTATWYEVTIKATGLDANKISFSNSFVLGPKGRRYLGWVSLNPKSHVVVTFQRTPKADMFLVADCVSRVVSGVAISPEVDIAVDDLMPHLQPLFPVGQALREGDWKRAGALLVATLRHSPQTLTALHTFLQRTGVRLPRDVLGSRIASGFGAISAVISAASTVNLPKQERVVLSVR